MPNKNVPEAPHFSARVHNVEELLIALRDGVLATGGSPADLEFNGVVRVEAEDAGEGSPDATRWSLTIIKRN